MAGIAEYLTVTAATRTIWLNARAPLTFPESCPRCLAVPCTGVIRIADRPTGLLGIDWPHCNECTAAATQESRAKKILLRFFVAGIGVFFLGVASQFLGTSIPDSTFLVIGILGGVSVQTAGAFVVGWGALMEHRRSRRRAISLPPSIGTAFWEGDDPFPPLGRPVHVSVEFHNAQYADIFLALNADHASASFDELREKPAIVLPPEGMEQLSEIDYAGTIQGANQRRRDELSDSSQMSGVAAIVIFAMIGVLPLLTLATGRVRSPLADHRVLVVLVSTITIVACAGFFLRINVARVFLAVVQFSTAAAATIAFGGELFKRWHIADLWKMAAYAAASWWLAFALIAPASRRLCSRWGRLERFIKPHRNPGDGCEKP